MQIQKICVLGAGVMGHGIAQVCAAGGYQVTLWDIEEKFVQSGMNNIHTPWCSLNGAYLQSFLHWEKRCRR